MMNLEALRARIAAQFIQVGEWRIGKLWAADKIALGKLLAGTPDTESERDARLVPYYAALLSKTLLNEAGEHPYDSDEGRELLAKLDEVLELGDAATEFNQSKKK